MHSRWRRVALAAAALLTAAGTPLALAGPASASGAVTLRLLSPATDATVTGPVTATVEVGVTDPTAVPEGSAVELTLGETSGPVLRADVAVPSGCAPSCQVSAVLDSGQFRSPDAGAESQAPDAGALADGPAVLGALLRAPGSSDVLASTSGQVTVDNGRPVLTDPRSQPIEALPVDSAVGLRYRVTVAGNAATGSPVTSVHLWRPGAWDGGTGSVEQVFPVAADGSATMTAPTSAMVTGSFSWIYFAARSADGTWSALHLALLRHSRGFTIDLAGLPTDGSPLVADAKPHLTLTPHYETAVGNTWAASVYASLDGTRLGDTLWLPEPTTWRPYADGTPVDVTLPVLLPGEHTLTYTLTDSWGVTRAVSVPVTVSPVLTGTWNPPAAVWSNQLVTVSPTLTSASEPLTGWRLTEGTPPTGSGVLGSADGLPPAQSVRASATVTTAAMGWHSVFATAQQTDGDYVTTEPWRYYVSPDASAVSFTVHSPTGQAVSSVRSGGVVYVAGKAVVTDGPRKGQGLFAPVWVQFRATGTTTWRTVASTTSFAGSFDVGVRPSGTGSWRVYVPQHTDSQQMTSTASSSTTRGITVGAALSAAGPGSVRAGRVYTYSARTSPYEAGLRLTVRYRRAGASTWYGTLHPAVRSDGTASWGARLPARYGTWVWQVLRPSTTRAAGTSVTRTVSVRS